MHRVAALASELRSDLHLGCGEIGLLLASFMIAGVLLSLPSCMIFGRLEDRMTLLCGLGTLILSSAILAQSTEFMGALVGRFDVVAGFETHGLTGAVYLTVPLPAVAAITVMMVPLGSDDAAPDTTVKLWSISRHKFWLIIIAGLACPLVSSGGYVVFSIYGLICLVEQGMTAAGLMVGILSWLIIVTIPLGGYLVNRTGRRDQTIWVGCLISTAVITMIPVGGPAFVWIVFSAAMGFMVGAVMSLPSGTLSANSRATGMGLSYTLYYTGTAVFPAVAGSVYKTRGVTEAGIWFSAGQPVCISPVAATVNRLAGDRGATVDDQGRAGSKGACSAGEIHRDPRDFVWLADAA